MKLLYISCHSILEYDELKIFSKFDYLDIFSCGAYLHPDRPPVTRPPLNFKVSEEDYSLFIKSRKWDTEDFISRFDIVYFMHRPYDLIKNWELLKNKIVILRMIGQSSDEIEFELKKIKDNNSNLKIIRYSPKERNHKNYAGESDLIRFGKSSDEYYNWNGVNKNMISIGQSIKARGDACGWNIFHELSTQIPTKLFGNSNEDAGELWNGRSLSYIELLNVYRDYGAYLYTGTKPASYCLNFIESWMTGIPVIAIGKQLGNGTTDLYEIENFIINGENGFISNNIQELKSMVKEVLDNSKLAEDISKNGRISAIKLFDESIISKQWDSFFKSII